MFDNKLRVELVHPDGTVTPAPIAHLDSFSMRSFTNDAVFDDTLPIADGRMEAGHRVPLALLQERMQDWFRRKNYLPPGSTLRIDSIGAEPTPAGNDRTSRPAGPASSKG